jgi:hypothetical protein
MIRGTAVSTVLYATPTAGIERIAVRLWAALANLERREPSGTMDDETTTRDLGHLR